MTILTLECPGCSKRTIIDADDEECYCMHCGARFAEAAVEEAEPIDEMLESALAYTGALGEGYVPKDCSGEPWYPDFQAAVAMLEDDDPEGAADALAALLDANMEAFEDIEACVRDAVAGWLVDLIAEGVPYEGGLTDIARVVEEYGEDSGPNVLIASLFYALAQTTEIIAGPTDSAVVAETLFDLLLDYPEVEPDIRMQLELCTDYMHVSGILIDIADSLSDDEEELEEFKGWIYQMQDFVKILGDAIHDATMKPSESELDALADTWMESDISTIGANVRDIADGFLDGEIDEGDARRQLDEYVSLYMSG